jgi:hypothetical protein
MIFDMTFLLKCGDYILHQRGDKRDRTAYRLR